MILIKDINKVIGDKTILDGINLRIFPGEITFIVGSSGSGKTTLLNLIGGLDTATSGTIMYNETDITDNFEKYRSETVGFIFQDYNLITGLSVKKNIELGLLYSHKNENQINIDNQITLLGIKDENQPVQTMSGGEKQR